MCFGGICWACLLCCYCWVLRILCIFCIPVLCQMSFPGSSVVKNLPANAGDMGLIAWRRKWQPTPVFLPGKSHGQRSLASYSPWGHKRVGHNLATKQLHQVSLLQVFLFSQSITYFSLSWWIFNLIDIVRKDNVKDFEWSNPHLSPAILLNVLLGMLFRVIYVFHGLWVNLQLCKLQKMDNNYDYSL